MTNDTQQRPSYPSAKGYVNFAARVALLGLISLACGLMWGFAVAWWIAIPFVLLAGYTVLWVRVVHKAYLRDRHMFA